jgi:hypothetical protein
MWLLLEFLAPVAISGVAVVAAPMAAPFVFKQLVYRRFDSYIKKADISASNKNQKSF